MFGWFVKRLKLQQGLRVEVGADLVRIADIGAALETFGERYLKRVFTDREVRYCTRSGTDAALGSLAARFAAKEAVMKILRPDANTDLPWTSIEVIRAESGAPDIALSGNAARLANAAGIARFALSLSHDGDYATATALAMRFA